MHQLVGMQDCRYVVQQAENCLSSTRYQGEADRLRRETLRTDVIQQEFSYILVVFPTNRKQGDTFHWSTGSRKPAVIPVRQQTGREKRFIGQQAIISQTGSRKPAVIPVRQ